MMMLLAFGLHTLVSLALAAGDGYLDKRQNVPNIGAWPGWGAGIYNNRSAGADGTIASGNVNGLSELCATRFAAGVSAPPLIEDDMSYFTTWTGLLVAQQYETCKTVWTLNITKVTLTFGPVTQLQNVSGIGPVSRSTPVSDGTTLFLGTVQNSLLLAVRKSDGDLLSTLQLDKHELAVISGSVTLYDGKLYLGVSSLEITTPGVVPNYKCCSLVGSMTASVFQNSRLKLIWQVETITQPKNVTGPAFSGGSVWGSQPAIDEARRQVIIGTGNTHSVPDQFTDCQNATQGIAVVQQGLVADPCLPPNVYQDSIMAFDLDTGRINWATQLSGIDAWNVACVFGNHANCPAFPGPDGDFGMAPTFVPGSANTPGGIDIVVVGQKNGYLFALSAQAGRVQWARQVSPAGLTGGLSWGIAVDGTAAYYTAINAALQNFTLESGKVISNSFFGAQSLKDGSTLWQTPVPRGIQSQVPPSIVNDVVITGSSGKVNPSGALGLIGTGSVIALSKSTGKILSEYRLKDYFQGGIAVVQNHLVFGTGYKMTSQPGGIHVWKA